MITLLRGRVKVRYGLFALALLSAPASAQVTSTKHPLTVDDVLSTVSLERAAISPDGSFIAAVVQRPALDGEIYGRTAHEVDPSRSDVWLISRQSDHATNITEGARQAAGYWCAIWSPTGKRLAMLSTTPEGGEPRGGNSVHLYVWDRETNKLERLSSAAIANQTRYGSPVHAVSMQAEGFATESDPKCRRFEENSPYVWIDDHRLIALALPVGEVSPLLDQYGRSFAHEEETRQKITRGIEPTASKVDSISGSDPLSENPPIELLLLDLDNRTTVRLATFHPTPFDGVMAIRVSPDLSQVAILMPEREITLGDDHTVSNSADWRVEKRLGFLRLAAGAETRWMNLDGESRFPLELFTWAPKGHEISFRARPTGASTETAYFAADARTYKIRRLGASLVSSQSVLANDRRENGVQWATRGNVLVRGHTPVSSRDDWWLVRHDGSVKVLTESVSKPPSSLTPTAAGGFVALSDGSIINFKPENWRAEAVATSGLPDDYASITPDTGRRQADWLVLQPESNQNDAMAVRVTDGHLTQLPSTDAIRSLLDQRGSVILWRNASAVGSSLSEVNLETGQEVERFSFNNHLAQVDWGETKIFDYEVSGNNRKAAVILPPGFDRHRKYPVITWIYPGYFVDGPSDYYLDPYLPGIFNLQLYAAKGFVVLIPSVPSGDAKRGLLADQYINAVDPAVDGLIAQGFVDPARISIMGHSLGGFAVYSMVTRTNRFSAAIALSGLTDLAQYYYQLDPAVRGYGALEAMRVDNAGILERGSGFRFGGPPSAIPDEYAKQSPLRAVGNVETPMLIVHGELDSRGSLAQADTFFAALKRDGKEARLLRYWGETHSLGQSPANIRDIVAEITRWLGRHKLETDTGSLPAQ